MPVTHIPTYNYCGPGTWDFSKKPKNDLDTACRAHDISYNKDYYRNGKRVSPYYNYTNSDETLRKKAKSEGGISGNFVADIFQAKKLAFRKVDSYGKPDYGRAPSKRKYKYTDYKSGWADYEGRTRKKQKVKEEPKEEEPEEEMPRFPGPYTKKNPQWEPYYVGKRTGGGRKSRFANIRYGGYTGIEKKFYDTFLVAGTLTAPTDASGGEHDPSATIVLNSVPQGDGESQRDGRHITCTYLTVRGNIQSPSMTNQTVAELAPHVYVCVVLDKQTNGATITSEQVFCNPSASALLAADPFINLQFQSRFRVLKFMKLKIPMPTMSYDGTNVETSGTIQPFKFNINLKKMKTTFNGTTESVANITDKSLHVIAFTSSAGMGSVINYNARLRFHA